MPVAADTARRVREQYERLPFPTVRRIEEEDPSRDLAASYTVDFDLPPERALRPGARLWVAGASTRWATMVALQFRDAHVVATDFSAASLAFQERLARELRVENIEFRNEDILAAEYDAEFDYVSCCGVLHHLASQERGIAVLARALKPGGLLELMVYDSINRRLAARLQSMLRILDPAGALDAGERLDTAREMLTHLSPDTLSYDDPLRALGRLVARADEGELSDLADVVSHPHELSYDVPTLFRLLDGAGLQLRRWKNEELFHPRFSLDDPELAARIEALDEEPRSHVCQLIAGQMLELFVEKVDAPGGGDVPPPVEERTVRAITDKVVHHVSGGRVVRSARRSRLRRADGGYQIDSVERRPCVSAYGLERVLPPVAVEILAHAERPAKIGDIAAKVARRHKLGHGERARLVALCDAMCRPPTRVLATVTP